MTSGLERVSWYLLCGSLVLAVERGDLLRALLCWAWMGVGEWGERELGCGQPQGHPQAGHRWYRNIELS